MSTLAAARSVQKDTSGEETDLRQAILDALIKDPQVGEYLYHIRDLTIERDKETSELLKPFSANSDRLVLYNRIVYVLASETIKL